MHHYLEATMIQFNSWPAMFICSCISNSNYLEPTLVRGNKNVTGGNAARNILVFLTFKKARGGKKNSRVPWSRKNFLTDLTESTITTGGSVFTRSERALSHTSQEVFQPIGLSQRTFLLDFVLIPGIMLRWWSKLKKMGSWAPLRASYHSKDLS